MSKELYRSGNYVIADNDGVRTDYPIVSPYTERNGNFALRNREGKLLEIAFAGAGAWTDTEGGAGIAYSEATMRTFLRENTGFSAASGGSGAGVKSYNARWDFSPFGVSESVLIKNDTGLILTANKDSRGVGTYSIRVDGGSFVDETKVQLAIACCQIDGKFIIEEYQPDRVNFRCVDSAGGSIDSNSIGVDIALNIFE